MDQTELARDLEAASESQEPRLPKRLLIPGELAIEAS